MKKVLYISNIAGKRASANFFGTALAAASELGLDFYIVANRSASSPEEIRLDEEKYGAHLLHADISRSPFSLSNVTAYKQIMEIIRKYNIDYIHCNTPVGGVLGRLVGVKGHVKKTIYQAHGFHFYKGAPIKNWFLYYPAERYLAHYTDALVTINKEDYARAQKFNLRSNGRTYYVPGVGIDTKQFEQNNFDRQLKRKEMAFKESDVLVISAGDLIKRKNYETAIRAIERASNPNLHYIICGDGPLKNALIKRSHDLHIENQVHFLGFRTDIKELLWASDIFLLTSYQEGLPRSLSEAMACGLPCVASNIRGNSDLINSEQVGLMFEPNDSEGFGKALKLLSQDSDLREKMKDSCKTRIQKFDFTTVKNAIRMIYQEEFAR